MNKFASRIIILCILVLCAHSSLGAQLKVFVSGFAVTGDQSKDELKAALPQLLMSRLNGDLITVVDSPSGADVSVAGSYVMFGKIFSLDALAKNSAGDVVARAYVQGDSQDELIPAVGKLAKALSDGLVKSFARSSSVSPSAAQLPAPQKKLVVPDVVRKDVVPASPSDIVRPAEVQKSSASGWVSQRIEGAMSGLAMGRTLENGEREIFITGIHILQYYRQGKELKLIAEVPFAVGEKILGVDSADLDGDGIPEIYLTIMDGDTLASQVWVPADNSLKRIAGKLPYFFRGMALEGKEKKIYAQEQNIDGEFYGDVYELVKSGDKFTLHNPLKLPRFGYLYNFNRFADAQGRRYFVLINPDGYLLVYSPELEQLWKSSDKFGGSELYFKRPPQSTPGAASSFANLVFLDQRITVTTEGEIIVPQNAGFWVIGYNRSYSKASVFSFTWNGSSLEERWHTRQDQNYLADYTFDERTKELLLLEVVQKEGLIAKGASAVAIKKAE